MSNNFNIPTYMTLRKLSRGSGRGPDIVERSDSHPGLQDKLKVASGVKNAESLVITS